MAHDVFVSYSSKDKAVADAIVAALENNNIRCWYAPRDIRSGEDWGKAITAAIEECRVFLVIFSAHSNRSQRVLDEVNLAISQQDAIIPFRIENLEPDGAMKLHLSSRHWLDAYEPSWQSHLKKLVNNISANLSEEIKESEVDLPASVRKARGKGGGVVAGIAAAAVVAAAAWYFLPPTGFTIPAMMMESMATPTATLEPEATETMIPATPTATLHDSVAELGEPDYEENFSDTGFGAYWPIGAKDTAGYVEIDGDGENSWMVVRNSDAALNKGTKTYVNTIMEVDARFGATNSVGNSGSGDWGTIALYCREREEAGLGAVMARLYDDGSLEVFNEVNGIRESIESSTVRDFDPEQTNRIRLDCVGNSFQFLVNGEIYATGELETASFSGHIGLSSGEGVAEYENFKLWIK